MGTHPIFESDFDCLTDFVAKMNFDEADELRSTFTTYLAEGDKLFTNGDYTKALEAYSKALQLKPGDKTCLVSRSKCYLHIGDAESALKDADECIKDDKTYHKGLYQRAEALYQMGSFEFALMYFHRGNSLRPELAQFRLGIQKCQEAIENSVGSPETIELDTRVSISKNRRQTLDFRQKRHFKEEEKRVASEKTAKALLGELYKDRQYLEQLAADELLTQSEYISGESISEIINNGIRYLDNRTEFWRQQKPMYTRKREKSMLKPLTTETISKHINGGMKALEEGNAEEALSTAVEANKTIEMHPDKRKSPHVLTLQADVNQLYGKALLEMGKLEEAIQRHKVEVRVSKQSGLTELKIRAMDNLAEAYVKNGQFDKALKIYSDRVKMSKGGSESAWLFHNWGRCLLEMSDLEGAEAKGKVALKNATQANDKAWQLNSKVLVAQAQLKSRKLSDAEKTFTEALALAKSQEDEVAAEVIKTQLAQISSFNQSTQPSSEEAPAEEPELPSQPEEPQSTANLETGELETENNEPENDENEEPTENPEENES